MSPTRRQVLRGAVPAVLGLTGCVSSDGPDNDGDDDSSRREDDRAAVEDSGRVSDPSVVKPRNPDGRRVLDPPEDEYGVGFLVGSTETAEALRFQPGVPSADVTATREFLAATDFTEETVYVTHIRPRSCYQYRIHSVTWQYSDVEYEYCRELRSPDEQCVADTRVGMALCFRLPAVVDMDVHSGGSSGRFPCEGSTTDYAVIESNATVGGTTTTEDTAGEDR
ncbi:hypothetical protein [Halorhabdus amylolytica]|uniref:hypothetical protein n=1 Tax=Halorhabdus amylolytica TaxID=2559573 RepID=UPI0010A9E18F|nr:hypothetical protein [Halorhabdus amylolytica]